jgi:hypothetical protein
MHEFDIIGKLRILPHTGKAQALPDNGKAAQHFAAQQLSGLAEPNSSRPIRNVQQSQDWRAPRNLLH